MFNDILDNVNRETFLHCKKDKFSVCQKSHISKGVDPRFWSTMQFFLQLFSFKTRLEVMFNDILDNINKETFLHCKKDNFSECQTSHFSKGVNP